MDLTLAKQYPFDIKDWNEVDTSTLTLPITDLVSQDFTKCDFKEDILKLTEFSWHIREWVNEGEEITKTMNKLVAILKDRPDLEGLRYLIATISRYVDHYNICKIEKHFIKSAFEELREFLEAKAEELDEPQKIEKESVQYDEPIKEEISEKDSEIASIKEVTIPKKVIPEKVILEKPESTPEPVLPKEKINLIDEVNKISSKLLLTIIAILYIIAYMFTNKPCCNQCYYGRNQ